jgi:hypothetical protein
MDRAMMLIAELDEVVEVGPASVDPVDDMVDIGEFGVRGSADRHTSR